MVLHTRLRLAPAQVNLEHRANGDTILRSPQPLRAYERCIGDWLVQWARQAPERVFLAERAGEGWRKLTYAEALGRRAAHRPGAARPRPRARAAARDPLGQRHRPRAARARRDARRRAGRAGLARLLADVEGLREAEGNLRAAAARPGVCADDPAKFAPALAAVGAQPTPIAAAARRVAGCARGRGVRRASGPTRSRRSSSRRARPALPKGVINTQRMLCSNQQMLAQVWPFLEDRPPVLVDWLPWNHTFGGNFNFNLMLRNGGTLYIDGGKPAPGLIETTARNLREVSPTLYFNVPRGFDLLLPFLEQRRAAARRTSSATSTCCSTPRAALPQNLWERLEASAIAEGRRAGDALGLGLDRDRAARDRACTSRSTAPASSACPMPGCELKLVPAASKLEVRVRGPERHARLLPPRRPDARGVRRGRLLPHRRRDALRRSGGARTRAGLRRPRRRGLQALVRHLGARRRGAREADRRGQSDHPGRGDHRATTATRSARWSSSARRRRQDLAPAAVRAKIAGALARHSPPTRRKLDAPDARARAGRAAVDRRERDHRQGLHQPARGARAAHGAGRSAAREDAGRRRNYCRLVSPRSRRRPRRKGAASPARRPRSPGCRRSCWRSRTAG